MNHCHARHQSSKWQKLRTEKRRHLNKSQTPVNGPPVAAAPAVAAINAAIGSSYHALRKARIMEACEKYPAPLDISVSALLSMVTRVFPSEVNPQPTITTS